MTLTDVLLAIAAVYALLLGVRLILDGAENSNGNPQ